MKKLELDVHYISEDGLPKKDGTYLVWPKNGAGCYKRAFDMTVNNATMDDTEDHPGFYDDLYNDWNEIVGFKEVTDEILAWADIESLEVLP